MKVEQLSDDEMYELKDKLYTDFYYNQEALPPMIATERNVLASATYPTDIPDWLMYPDEKGLLYANQRNDKNDV